MQLMHYAIPFALVSCRERLESEQSPSTFQPYPKHCLNSKLFFAGVDGLRGHPRLRSTASAAIPVCSTTPAKKKFGFPFASWRAKSEQIRLKPHSRNVINALHYPIRLAVLSLT